MKLTELQGSNRRYRAAIYLRLSDEDGRDESQSIDSQRQILRNYINNNPQFVYVNEYVDDGFSGTKFNRPGFKDLISDIEKKKIDLVITKDLSRLGRNYIQTGYYIEEYFPAHNVRYIALTDMFDTLSVDDYDFTPFKNIINEWYARDTSKKTRSSINIKAKNGEPLRTVTPIFGYKYNETNERVPDAETAPIVVLIYEKYLEFGSTTKVAEFLKKNKYKTPTYYNAVKYGVKMAKLLKDEKDNYYNWSRRTIESIIKRDEYLGTYRTSISSVTSYKNKKRQYNKECYVFEKRYEPLVSDVAWYMANQMINGSKSGSVSVEDNFLKGLIFCGYCSGRMSYENRTDYRTHKKYKRYYCRNAGCSRKNSISYTVLLDILRDEILKLKKIIIAKKEEFIEYATNIDLPKYSLQTDASIELDKKERKKCELNMFLENLLDINVSGEIPDNTYTWMKNKYEKELQLIESDMSVLKRKMEKSNNMSSNRSDALKFLKVLKSVDEENPLNTNLIKRIVKSISVKNVKSKTGKAECEINIRYYKCNSIIEKFLNEE